MRLSELRTLVAEEFGAAYARSLMATLHLTSLGSRTADEALEAGTPPRRVWVALCEAMDVPEERRLGRDRKPAR